MKTCSLLATFAALFGSLIGHTSSARADKQAGTWRGQSVTEFTAQENSKLGWQVVNDGVMGGLSEGSLKFTDDGTMKFTGDLSLKNNGGFSTVRSKRVNLDLSNDLGLLLYVKGDGRTYQARFDSDARYRGMPVSFAGEFQTTKGEWQQIKIPFSEFKGSFRGIDLPKETLNPAAIEGIGILLGDKREGAFSLEIGWIRTFGKGQGKDLSTADASPSNSLSKRDAAIVDDVAGVLNLIDTLVADGRFTVLKTALDRAGLTAFFQWDNKLTVFAPTDEAFRNLPEGTLAELLLPENKDRLVGLLSYHVSPGANSLPELLGNGSVEAVRGGPLNVKFSDGSVRVNDGALLEADVQCTDGVIHVIDSVLLPSAES